MSSFDSAHEWSLAEDDFDPYDENQLHITFMIVEVSVSSISPSA